MKNSKPTQCERIKQYIAEFGSITTLEAFTELGIVRLGARISEMRKRGEKITSKTETVKNRYGDKCHIKRYSLEQGDGKQEARCCQV